MKKVMGRNSAAGKNFEIWRRLTLKLTLIFLMRLNEKYYMENFTFVFQNLVRLIELSRTKCGLSREFCTKKIGSSEICAANRKCGLSWVRLIEGRLYHSTTVSLSV